jgi:hypothetical protein
VQAPALQVLIGTALTDRDFCRALLNGSRGKILRTFPLTPQEIDIIMDIRADTLEEFAGQLHENFLAAADDPDPLPTRRPMRLKRAERMTSPLREPL